MGIEERRRQTAVSVIAQPFPRLLLSCKVLVSVCPRRIQEQTSVYLHTIYTIPSLLIVLTTSLQHRDKSGTLISWIVRQRRILALVVVTPSTVT